MRVSASILSCDLLNLRGEIERLVGLGITALHLDIMDGVFVNEIFLGEDAVRQIVKEFPKLEIECHLMVCNPLNTIKNLDLSIFTRVIVHNNPHMSEISTYFAIHKGCLGIALSPMDALDEVPIPENTRKILVMGVVPGRGGQAMLPDTPDRITAVKQRYGRVVVGVDGGVNEHTIRSVLHADEFVLGSCLFQSNAQDVLQFVNSLM